ncbi:OsmC family protein [Chryseobacterium indologenes]|uniref:OsmC family protein n=1 Tax=Chryseobacterium indologenes TaxID=253 RepID=UPI00162531CA|nr:OsmC family protein [Chryseobacterium indologenes]MBF6646512.1 OsmC family protein [Chryseobacterium indologenes]MBU3046873.1 OsmC family protein [Chryseobacterium indologenes]MEB4762010.1 OsmC family protein [Chryseobacterium indologenes]QQQ69823.1 OsmC family protein [Chryseobacterium indologenes]
MRRNATAVWNGTIKEGKGYLTTQSTTLNQTQYSFNSRFADGVGTNPEELLAAAHAGCFTMKLDAELSQAGYNPEELKTTSVITLDPNIGKITKSELTLTAKVPGISDEEFQKFAKIAEEGCPVSAAFNFEITLNATLEQ